MAKIKSYETLSNCIYLQKRYLMSFFLNLQFVTVDKTQYKNNSGKSWPEW